MRVQPHRLRESGKPEQKRRRVHHRGIVESSSTSDVIAIWRNSISSSTHYTGYVCVTVIHPSSERRRRRRRRRKRENKQKATGQKRLGRTNRTGRGNNRGESVLLWAGGIVCRLIWFCPAGKTLYGTRSSQEAMSSSCATVQQSTRQTFSSSFFNIIPLLSFFLEEEEGKLVNRLYAWNAVSILIWKRKMIEQS